MLRAVIYARVSSAAQRDQQTVESQLHVLRPYVTREGWQLVDTYVDDGRSAKTGMLDRRDQWQRLMRDAEAGRFDILVTLDVNRLTRTGSIEERAEILGPFQRLGIQIATPSAGIQDLRSFLGEFYVTLQALVAAEENRKRATAISAGKLRAIAEGRKPAGPTPYGYTYTRATGQWSINEATAAIVREVFRRVVAGESCAAIAEDLYIRNVPCLTKRAPWERHKVWVIATSRTYVGEWTADKRKRLTMKVPPIIDEQTYQRAQDKLVEAGKRGLIKTKHVYLLEGLATCAMCGSPIHIRSAMGDRAKQSPPAYVCRARKVARLGEERCIAPIALVSDVDGRVWDRIAEVLEDPELVAALERRAGQQAAEQKSWRSDVDEWKRRLGKLEKHEAAVLARFRREQIGEAALDLELAAVARERGALQAQLETAERAQREIAGDVVRVDDWLDAIRRLGSEGTPAAKQRVVRALVRKGGAILDDCRVRLTLRVRLGAREQPHAAPVLSAVGSDYSSHHGKTGVMVLRIRLVA
jgi:site-specific DNA recombinase